MQIDYNSTLKKIDKYFKNSLDIVKLEFDIADKKAMFYFIDGFIDKRVFEDHIFASLKRISKINYPYLKDITAAIVTTTSIICCEDVEDAMFYIETGEIVLVVEGAESFFICSEKSFPVRTVSEPQVNNVLRGPREGFIEDIKTNISLIRKRLYTSSFKTKIITCGKYTNTKVGVLYIDGIADARIVDDVIDKISKINIDGILESSYVARYLEDQKSSMFSRVGVAEKPDIIVGKMLEGRIAIVVDGSPTVLTVPFILLEHFQTSEDYYIKSFRATMLRVIRIIAVLIGVLLPGVYISLLEYQYQMLPLKFLSAVIKSTQNTPLTPSLEMLVVLIIFEILLEASIRMPRYIGMAIGVVGAIVLGDTAVSAGLLSSPTILIIAISTVSSYCIPDETNTISILRLTNVLVGAVLGIYGIILLAICVLAYLSSISSYGSSYLAPYAPLIKHDWQDGIIKSELYDMKERPYSIKTKNRTREK